jgi:hypothetical protein
MKLRTDQVEIRILDEIEALVSGKLEDETTGFQMN